MTLTVDLTPEEVARLSAEAAEHGLDISEYARRLPIERLNAPKQNRDQAVSEGAFYLSATPEAWKSALQAWSQSHNKARRSSPTECFDAIIYTKTASITL